MINIDVYSHRYIEIETEKFEINSREEIVKFLEHLLNRCFYSGETICLESVDINETDRGRKLYTEIDRWK